MKGVLSIAHKRNLFDQPNHRTVHKAPIPRLGGVAIQLAFLLGFLVLLGLNQFVSTFNSLNILNFHLVVVVGTLLLINIVGLYDDLKPIRAITKFLWQTITALIVIASGLYIKEFQIPFTDWQLDLGPIGPIVTYFWIVGISNAINLIDGMDGLAGGISTLAIAALGVYFTSIGLHSEALVCFLLVGALLAFLVFNFPPAKTFMGDSGSLVLGTALATFPLLGGDKSPFSASWILPPILVLIPIADTLGAIWRRLRDGRPVFSPDKEHMHHKLLYLGFSTRQILALVYLIELVLVSPLIVSGFSSERNNSIITFWFPLGAVVCLMIFFFVLHFKFRARVVADKLKSNDLIK